MFDLILVVVVLFIFLPVTFCAGYSRGIDSARSIQNWGVGFEDGWDRGWDVGFDRGYTCGIESKYGKTKAEMKEVDSAEVFEGGEEQ